MATNFAHIAFLVYALVLMVMSRNRIVYRLERRFGREIPPRHRAGANGFLFLSLKRYLPSPLFWINAVNFWFLLGMAGLHLLLGWFSFFALFFRIFNSLLMLSAGFEAFLICLGDNQLRFGRAFLLYQPDPDPDSRRVFASSVLDVFLTVVIPIAMVISNFTTPA